MRSVLTVALLVAGCAAPPPPTGWFAALANEHVDRRSWFPAADQVLEGFDAPGETARLEPGDRVLYGVAIADGDERDGWLVLAEVTDAAVTQLVDGEERSRLMRLHHTATANDGTIVQGWVESEILAMRVTLFDDRGVARGTNQIEVPRLFLGQGFHDVAVRLRDLAVKDVRTLSATDPRFAELSSLYRQGATAALAFFQIILESDQLYPILRRAIASVNLWDVILHGGIDITASELLTEIAEVDGEVPEAWQPDPHRFSIVLEVNDAPTLLCSVTVAPSCSPVNVGAGVVSIVARPPDAERRLVVQMLAARRGE